MNRLSFGKQMQMLPIATGRLPAEADVAAAFVKHGTFEEGDILVVSSKILALTEGAAIDLQAMEISDSAADWAKKHGRDAAFRQAVMDETNRMHGRIINNDSRAILTELQPDGFPEGTLLVASAGLDQSNVPEGFALGWPHDPVASVQRLRQAMEQALGFALPVLLTDSCLRPRRLGVVAQGLVASGFDPIVSQVDAHDLHGRPLRVTQEAVADQLATAANFVMGNAAQAIPAVIIRNHNLPFSEFEGWVPGIEVEEDLFHGVL